MAMNRALFPPGLPIAGFNRRCGMGVRCAAVQSAWSEGLGRFGGIIGQATCRQRIIIGDGQQRGQHPEFRWVNAPSGSLDTNIERTCQAFDVHQCAARQPAVLRCRVNRRVIPRRFARAAAVSVP